MGYRPKAPVCKCAVLHETADLEVEIYGEIVSESVAAHCRVCFIDPSLIQSRPPRGPGAVSLRHVLIAGPLPGRRE